MDLLPIDEIVTRSIDDLLNDILIECHGCPSELAKRRLREAHYQFCRETQVWRASHDPFLGFKAIQEYELDEPSFAKIDRIYYVEAEGDEVRPTARHYEARRNIRAYVQPNRTTLQFLFEFSDPADPPNEGDFVRPRVVLVPTDCSDQIDCRIYDDWRYRIIDGALWKLFIMPGKDWSDKDIALYRKQEFWRGIQECRFEVNRNYQNTGLQAKFGKWTTGFNSAQQSGGFGFNTGFSTRS